MKNIEIFRNIKVLEVHDDYFIGARGYKLYKYLFATKKYEYVAKINDLKYGLFSRFFLTRRLLRAEVTNLYMLSNGDRLAIAKKGIFRCESGGKTFTKCFCVPRGSRPMNLCVTPDGQLYFGEYFANMEKRAVHIYHSGDSGKNWNIVYTFEDGTINHVHGLFWDPYTKSIWVATGDREDECIIANTCDGFKTLNIILRGNQEYRATNLLFYKDFIVYATDSQYIVNEIRKIDRQTLKIEMLQQIQGSGIYGGQCGDYGYISASVEPSEVNKDQSTHLWFSDDGVFWRELYSAKKDSWNGMLFQFGSILFPKHDFPLKKFMFYGRAVRKIGSHSVLIEK